MAGSVQRLMLCASCRGHSQDAMPSLALSSRPWQSRKTPQCHQTASSAPTALCSRSLQSRATTAAVFDPRWATAHLLICVPTPANRLSGARIVHMWHILTGVHGIQAGLISNPMNDMSSCESDSADDPSLRRSLRGAGRKSKVHTACYPFPHAVLCYTSPQVLGKRRARACYSWNLLACSVRLACLV